jgi:hypothetical protein
MPQINKEGRRYQATKNHISKSYHATARVIIYLGIFFYRRINRSMDKRVIIGGGDWWSRITAALDVPARDLA